MGWSEKRGYSKNFSFDGSEDGNIHIFPNKKYLKNCECLPTQFKSKSHIMRNTKIKIKKSSVEMIMRFIGNPNIVQTGQDKMFINWHYDRLRKFMFKRNFKKISVDCAKNLRLYDEYNKMDKNKTFSQLNTQYK